MSNPIVCIDFDGVIHSYSTGWADIHIIKDKPVPGAFDAIRRFLDNGWDVQIFSSRSYSPFGRKAMREWLERWAYEEEMGEAIEWTHKVSFPVQKPPALVSIDDRGLTFNGDWSVFDPVELRGFKPWNKR